jgi:hypothetical protein
MAASIDLGGGWGGRLRLTGWSAVALLLVLPLAAMQFTNEVNWTGSDFVLAGVMLGGTGLFIELAMRMNRDPAYRAAAAIALLAALFLIWATLAVGVIGSEEDPVNLMFPGVLGIGLAGAMLARFRPTGMARTLAAMSVAQVATGAIALTAGAGMTDPRWPWDIFGATLFFTGAWLVSARLFAGAGAAARQGSSPS